jgi:two-component system, OmpR family, sensor histidine kinase ChvG
METTNRPPLAWRLFHSFTLKLLILALILLSLPVVLYWQFQTTERAQLGLLRNAADQTGRVIAAMLRPHFVNFTNESPSALQVALTGASIGNTKVKVLLRMAQGKADDFIFIASAPPLSADYLKQEMRELIRAGINQRLAPTCAGTTDFDVHYVNPAGAEEVLTSMTPVHIDGNCWVVITAQNASDLAPAPLHLSFWTVPLTQAAACIYILSTALIVWLFGHMWFNLSRFRAAARNIRRRGSGVASFRQLNSIPELTGVADDFDSLVGALTASQDFIIRAAEENAHALKAPLAVIAQSIEPLKRVTPRSDVNAQRSLQLIERSISRLDSLVSAARDMEQAVADVVYPSLHPIDLSEFLRRMLKDYEASLAARGISLVQSLGVGIVALANEDLLEPVIENILENAASFTAKDGTIDVVLDRESSWARITVADNGPGVAADKLALVFDRYASFREGSGKNAPTGNGESHQGLGLWIVKRNIEGIGGTVTAQNRKSGGFEICIRLKHGA